MASQPDVARFLKGVSQLNLPVIHRFPTWDMHLVLEGLAMPPFKSMHQIKLQGLNIKTVLLISMTSARRISELGALSVNFNLCIFHRAKVVLRPNPAFIPKINIWFHRAQAFLFP